MQTEITNAESSTLYGLALKCHKNSVDHGFYDDIHAAKTLESSALKLLLIHTEISEVFEALRRDNPQDDHVELLGESAELADAMIRILDYCAWKEIDIGAAVQKKHAYNMTRPYKHGKNC